MDADPAKAAEEQVAFAVLDGEGLVDRLAFADTPAEAATKLAAAPSELHPVTDLEVSYFNRRPKDAEDLPDAISGTAWDARDLLPKQADSVRRWIPRLELIGTTMIGCGALFCGLGVMAALVPGWFANKGQPAPSPEWGILVAALCMAVAALGYAIFRMHLTLRARYRVQFYDWLRVVEARGSASAPP